MIVQRVKVILRGNGRNGESSWKSYDGVALENSRPVSMRVKLIRQFVAEVNYGWFRALQISRTRSSSIPGRSIKAGNFEEGKHQLRVQRLEISDKILSCETHRATSLTFTLFSPSIPPPRAYFVPCVFPAGQSRGKMSELDEKARKTAGARRLVGRW